MERLGTDWAAGALLYSGRPDPTWTVAPEVAERLVDLWRGLPAGRGASPPRSILGYRGCWLRSAGGVRLVARDGVVLEEGGTAGSSRPDVREDPGRAFERALLATAPAGVLPPGLAPELP